MTNHRSYSHYLALFCLLAIGTILRFWHLDLKPLWLDEVITAIFSLGNNYQDLQLDVLIPLQQVQEIFTFRSGVSCPQIAANIARQSTHPPLFFCLMHYWLGWLTPLGEDWIVKLRSLPVLFGVGAIAAIYGVNRIAFSPKSGIIAAAFMAVSPFAVYLSQEARHYTLPMLCISLALLMLMQIQRNLAQGIWKLWVWLLWVVINIIGFYIHYFFALVFIAEIATLLMLLKYHNFQLVNQTKLFLTIILSISIVIVSFLPWMITTFNHAQRAETNWLDSPTIISPIYQIIMNWILMVIFLPVENQPLIVVIISGVLMLAFTIFASLQVFRGLKQLWIKPATHSATLTLLSFTGCILLQIIVIAYLTNKDITSVPRYSFVYYPGFCALLAASLSVNRRYKFIPIITKNFKSQNLSILIFIFVGLLSSIFVVHNLVFQKPFQPDRVAQNLNLDPSSPVILVTTYSNYQDAVLGISIASALEQVRSQNSQPDNFVALSPDPDLSAVWKKISQLPISVKSPLNLWIVGRGMRRQSFPQQLLLSNQTICQLDPKHHYRIGIRHQLYRCEGRSP
ncbi:glycosyltransferase family 39 protein [Anabaena azotica]|uniref:Glycosyltransferase family 39 protein n=1 Tax=Anabaena azotica FACHB-119 TaxID=947527 RepID=A0ABR8D0K1_9NOST|nr:glycosyltransferase family 39 protein [Anabaena azotica]MBD2500714.1 glycosyltransferase family 39 protein [Anabaena azotica FACHB-119]